ncbi:unnamed protein product [Psylliodes chrysocephalus]|uniref:Uncharacterized protein n=1 Tax=Psylliodes chrysocephalus TaxID=3402493 RepID=A0A9P0D8U5_9CUCU|nr:unnamed protein product [Psylliodes chrysocephala]
MSWILKLRVGIKSAENYHRKNTSDIVENVKQLTADIKNSPYHTFGNHSNCAQYFCKREQNDRDYVTEMKECGLMDDIVYADRDYGLQCDDDNDDDDVLEQNKLKFLDSLPKSIDDICKIEVSTRGQASNDLWKEHRSNMLTA